MGVVLTTTMREIIEYETECDYLGVAPFKVIENYTIFLTVVVNFFRSCCWCGMVCSYLMVTRPGARLEKEPRI